MSALLLHVQLEMVCSHHEKLSNQLNHFETGVTVAAGSVVRGNITSNVVIAGNPARVIKHLKGPQVLA